MQLNLPILDQVAGSKQILIAGAGGGFDIFAGLPLYFTLREIGKSVHLANYSFSDIGQIYKTERLFELVPERLVSVSGPVQRISPYYPEGYLAQWFHETQGEDVPIWLFPRPGAKPLAEDYQTLVDYLKIDALILVDGGVDSLMQGDEEAPGTMLEDTITLSAVESLNLSVKLLACLGFGAEPDVGHHHALENIAMLVKADAFLGACALTPALPAFQHYQSASQYVMGQSAHAQSHINTSIIASINGNFGLRHVHDDKKNPSALISPLLCLYWFFDATVVAQYNALVEPFKTTQTVREAMVKVYRERFRMNIRPKRNLPY